ncbi:Asp-tRNA(Asn)/Glu-tRNA(Gln) amidotransferase subunit GatB [Candidatus Pelagibacter sp. FZCC0015]|uniref:Asp-tRNA(Asn)/Glu-tRNA(Gln) amidotransferase subunit GatB n=1 Tax=Candidatus Pelagibacter sp. FZCC0015 TaxID=2268451 RepID=UPI0011A38B64|nr:Asp-tRNA(Asn)/Glu-tRNA(Gln) amidotransferase subunit GatB [Candidatus Pelagibacter sp. FZCC0015]
MSKNKSEYLINRHDNQYEVVIGLEVHAQVTSESKLFSTSATKFGAEPNTQVSLVDAAFPGMLPVINEYCVKQAIKTGIGLKAKINKRSVFDRKNYFYADLPQGYQISQFKDPIVGEGKVILDMPDGQKEVGIERLHLEQDAGKSIHDLDPKNTFVDLNRSGVALMEIVSKPDLRSPDEVNAYIKKLRSIMRYLGTCDGNMQEGSLRADVNVSVRKKGSKEFGTRCEIKNVNSIKFMQMAIEYEANRQVDLIEDGQTIDQETRLFDTKKNETRSMRSKEDAHDYRYFPDPDLLPLEVSDDFIENLKSEIPELPDEKKKRFIEKFKLSPYEANILVSDIETSNYFENVIKKSDVKLATNWIIGELFAALNEKNLEITESPISAGNLSKLINLIKDGTISGKIAKTVFEQMMEGDKDPKKIVEEKGLKQESDPKALEALIDKVIDDNRDKATEYKSGKVKLFGFFVGQVMKVSGGKANPQLVNEILKKKL